jgi:hypothetical protein
LKQSSTPDTITTWLDLLHSLALESGVANLPSGQLAKEHLVKPLFFQLLKADLLRDFFVVSPRRSDKLLQFYAIVFGGCVMNFGVKDALLEHLNR